MSGQFSVHDGIQDVEENERERMSEKGKLEYLKRFREKKVAYSMSYSCMDR